MDKLVNLYSSYDDIISLLDNNIPRIKKNLYVKSELFNNIPIRMYFEIHEFVRSLVKREFDIHLSVYWCKNDFNVISHISKNEDNEYNKFYNELNHLDLFIKDNIKEITDELLIWQNIEEEDKFYSVKTYVFIREIIEGLLNEMKPEIVPQFEIM